jgi:hypothetical protein
MLRSAQKLEALVGAITREDFSKLPPAQRKHLAQLLRFIADLADPPKPAPEPGPLALLSNGERAENCALPEQDLTTE